MSSVYNFIVTSMVNAAYTDSVRGLFVLFVQIEFSRLLRKHNLENTGHVSIWKYCMRQTFQNAVEKSTVPMTHLQPINCFVPASQAYSKCVSRSAAILLSNFIKNMAVVK